PEHHGLVIAIDLSGADQLVLEVDAVPIGLEGNIEGLSQPLLGKSPLGGGRSPGGLVKGPAAPGIHIDVLTKVGDDLELLDRLNDKALDKTRRFEPWPVQLHNIHADA